VDKVHLFVIGIITTILGLIIFVPNSDGAGPEAYEGLYWVFGGCLLSLTGILVSIVALLWPNEPIVLESSAIEDEVFIPPPVISNKD
jgi:hypothetical protein